MPKKKEVVLSHIEQVIKRHRHAIERNEGYLAELKTKYTARGAELEARIESHRVVLKVLENSLNHEVL